MGLVGHISTIVLAERYEFMRPRLHPDMGIVPISARIAVQLAFWRFRRHQGMVVPPGTHCRFVLWILPDDLDSMLRLALHSLGVYLDLGYTSSEWLESVLEAAHFGHSFRRCFFFDYKANRSPYPRVTNRGVQTSLGSSLTRKQRDMLDE